jgi:CheY-like chemotaxis protein
MALSAVRTMIVDDHADVRFLIRTIIEEAGERVVVAGEAEDVRSALEAIDRVDPDLVVLDAVMPALTGFEAAPMILARRPGQKILLCTGRVDDEIRARCEEAGITECISKDDIEAIPAIVARLASAQYEAEA